MQQTVSRLLSGRTRLLLAVSGGVDSMCMAHLCVRSGVEVAVAHCNFRLRGEESDADALFVRRWAVEKGLKLYERSFDTSAYAASRGISLEMAARELRYEWFGTLCREEGFDAVVVAHNADDRAETFLMNLLRSSGGQGLRGMAFESRTADGLTVLRPLLDFSRTEIEAWMRSEGLPWREDASNADPRYRRNFLRGRVMPLLAEMNPSYRQALRRDMVHIGQLQSIADEWFASVRGSLVLSEDPLVLGADAMRKVPHREYALYRLLGDYGFREATLGELERALESGGALSGKRFPADGWLLLGSADRLELIPQAMEELPADASLVIDGPGEWDAFGCRIRVSLHDAASMQGALVQPRGILLMDAQKIAFPLTVRPWRAGDYLQPFGMRGRKKISDLLTDLHYSPLAKRRCRVLCYPGADDGRVAALLGERIDDTLRITKATRSILQVALIP